MPEGDTIHRSAARLRPALVGQTLLRFDAPRTPRPHPRRGETITAVEAKGKHLLVGFSGGLALQTHLGMTGSWHLYAAGDRWSRPAHLARCVLAVTGWQAVCFSPPLVRLVPATGRADPSATTGTSATEVGVTETAGETRGLELTGLADHLGPDLCRPDADLGLAVRRLGSIPDPGTTIDEVLLDQRVMAGVGNVFKSEVLWACRVHPFTPIELVDEPTRRALVATAARLLRSNLGTGRRTTVVGPPGSLAVYRRARAACRRCGTPIRRAQRGRLNRSTYWCPTCQRAPDPR